MTYEERIASAADKVQTRLSSLLQEKPGEYACVLEAMEYSLMAGGKRIRPLLTLEFCSLCGMAEDVALDAACAVEMVHSYSLIHDDLPCMDDDDMRRGKPSCHIQFGEATALLAGDGLLTLAFETIAASSSLDDEKKTRCILQLSRAAGAHGMIAGQIIDLVSENKQIDEQTLRLLCALKTGEMIRVAARLGCICAGASDKQVQAADSYAEKIGLAFQIEDDILDIIGNEERLGKPVGSDAASHKNTFATLYGIERSRQLVDSLTQEAKTSLCAFDFEQSRFLAVLADKLASRDN